MMIRKLMLISTLACLAASTTVEMCQNISRCTDVVSKRGERVFLPSCVVTYDYLGKQIQYTSRRAKCWVCQLKLKNQFIVNAACEDFPSYAEFCIPEDKQKNCGVTQDPSCGWISLNSDRMDEWAIIDLKNGNAIGSGYYTHPPENELKGIALFNRNSTTYEDSLFALIPSEGDQKYIIKHLKSGLCLGSWKEGFALAGLRLCDGHFSTKIMLEWQDNELVKINIPYNNLPNSRFTQLLSNNYETFPYLLMIDTWKSRNTFKIVERN